MSFHVPENPTPHDCFVSIEPLLGDVARHMMKAPLDAKARAGLAVEVAVYFVGNAACEMAKAEVGTANGEMPAPEFFRRIIDMIASDLERGGKLNS